jgi:hypothetical protein
MPLRRSLAWLVCHACLACETPLPDPPPKASRTDIPAGALNAVGAFAAGTDGAPKPDPTAGNPEQQGPGYTEDWPPPATGGNGGGSASPESVPL